MNAQEKIYGEVNYVQFGAGRTSGVLKMNIVKARLDRDVEMFGKMDPYVLVESKGKQMLKTSVAEDAGKTPEWDETYRLEIDDTKNILEIKICDEQPMFDRGIGSTSISVD